MGCTAGCLNIFLEEEKHIELFAETFIEVMNDELYEPLEKEDVISFFDTDGDIMFSLDAEPIFAYGHGYEHVIEFLEAFIKKASDVVFNGDYYSDWDNCCDICFLKFEYKDGKLSLMRLFSEVFGVECDECGEEIEMSDVEIYFDKERCPVCPECGAKLPLQNDEDYCTVLVDDFILADGEWIEPKDFAPTTEGDYYLTGVAPDEVTNAWKYEDKLADEGVLPELSKGSSSWDGLPRLHAAAEQGDEKAAELISTLDALDTAFAAELAQTGIAVEVEAEEIEDEEAETENTAEITIEIEGTAEEDVPTDEKKKSKWWIIPLIIALLAAGAAAVQLSELYDLLGLLENLIG